MKTIKFYDTSSLLLKADSLFEIPEEFAISSITLEELENIKTSAHKDADIKYAARKLINLLNQHIDEYKVVLYEEGMLQPVMVPGNDAKILACAYSLKDANTQIEFVTNDLCLKHLAKECLNKVSSVDYEEDTYTGYEEITLNENVMAEFYQDYTHNLFNLKLNEYIIIKNPNDEIVDVRKWDGQENKFLDSKPINSKHFGKISPQDIYQKMAIDSMRSNQLTVLRGRPGSGKSLLGLAYLFSLLEQYKIDKIYIFCNPVATRDSAKLGFYPGTKDSKLLDSQIGNFLVGKLGDITIIEQLINEGKLILVPAADCRGLDIPANSGVYITEAQNSSKDLMKLMVQRIGEGTKCVIEGDDKSQVDLIAYAGYNNGLKALSKVFRGDGVYGEVYLQNIHRSHIAQVADKM